MTIEKFLEEYKSIIEKDQPVIGTHGVIRFFLNKTFCPVTLVCYKKTKKYFHYSNYVQAGIELGLTWKDSNTIAIVADNKQYDISYSKRIRRILAG